MTFDLLDVNVWLALAADGHTLHVPAKKWFTGRGETLCAFCRVTQMALFRHLTNRAVMHGAVLTPEAAWSHYHALLRTTDIVWLAEPEGMEPLWEKCSRRAGATGGWWTDAYLAAFALGHEVRLVTFDRDFRRYEEDGLKLHLLGA